MRAECYDLHLYCDNEDARTVTINEKPKRNEHMFDEFPHRYTGHTQGDCYRQARRDGWKLGEETDLCPRCSGKRKG